MPQPAAPASRPTPPDPRNQRRMVIIGSTVCALIVVITGVAAVVQFTSTGDAAIDQQLYDDAVAEARKRATPVGDQDAGPAYVALMDKAEALTLAHDIDDLRDAGYADLTITDAFDLLTDPEGTYMPYLSETDLERLAVSVKPQIAEMLDALHRASQMPECHIPTAWFETGAEPAPDLSLLGALAVARLGLLGAVLAAREGDVDRACSRIDDAVIFGVRIGRTGTLIHSLASIGMLTVACDAMTLLATAGRLADDAALARLDATLAEARRDHEGLSWTFKSEYVFFVNACEFIRTDAGNNAGMLAQGLSERIVNADLTRGTELFHEILAAVEQPPIEARAAIVALDHEISQELGDASPDNPSAGALLAMLMPAMLGAVDKFFELDVRLDGTRVVLALERHRVAAGAYPDALDAVTPAVPADPFSGKPFVYRRDGEAFSLHAPGVNLTDDGATNDDIMIFPRR